MYDASSKIYYVLDTIQVILFSNISIRESKELISEKRSARKISKMKSIKNFLKYTNINNIYLNDIINLDVK